MIFQKFHDQQEPNFKLMSVLLHSSTACLWSPGWWWVSSLGPIAAGPSSAGWPQCWRWVLGFASWWARTVASGSSWRQPADAPLATRSKNRWEGVWVTAVCSAAKRQKPTRFLGNMCRSGSTKNSFAIGPLPNMNANNYSKISVWSEKFGVWMRAVCCLRDRTFLGVPKTWQILKMVSISLDPGKRGLRV